MPDIDPDLTAQPDYAERFSIARMRRENGVLEVALQTDGDELVWGYEPHEQISDLLEAIGRDPANRVIILTGTGENFLVRNGHSQSMKITPAIWTQAFSEGRRIFDAMLSIDAPMIAAINGPAAIHAELPLLCDITLMADTAYVQDAAHTPNGLVPSDGVHVVWPLLLGLNRARYFLLTGQKIGAAEAHRLGVVNEVMPREDLLPRAWELAEYLLTRPPVALRLSRPALLQAVKRSMVDNLSLGLMLEGMGIMDYWPHTAGGSPVSAPGVDAAGAFGG